MKTRFIRDGLIALAAVAGMTLAAGPAKAVLFETFDLTSDHCSGTGGCLDGGSGGTVTVTDNGDGTLTYVVDLNTSLAFVNTGGANGLGATFGFNLDVSPITASAITTGFSLISTSTGSIHIDGFGDFSYGINCDDATCGTGGSTGGFTGDLTFTIGGGLTLDDVVQSTGGAPNAFFAVDVLASNGNTGPIDASAVTSSCTLLSCTNPGPEPVPEPTSLALLGSGLAALGLLFGFRRRSTDVA